MDTHVKMPETSLKNNIIIGFLFIIIIVGILLVTLFQKVFHNVLLKEGIDTIVIEDISRQLIFITSGITMAVIIAVIVIVVPLVSTITNQLKRLIESMRIASQGNLDLEIEITSNDEVGQLTYSFNTMIRELKVAKEKLEEWSKTLEKKVEERTKDLRESESKYSTLVEYAKDGVIIVQDEMIRFANTAMLEISGYPLEEFVNVNLLKFIVPEHRLVVAERQEKIMGKFYIPAVYNVNMECKTGEVKELEISGGGIIYEGKQAEMGIVRNITGRKRHKE